ncbi:MAG: NADH-quinone oxidoreductase subunit J family protein [Acidimicrobiia bacterium]
MVAQNITFGIIAAVITFGALRVVTTRNVVHAALYLIAVLAGVGAAFLLLGAEFVGVTQILVYIGAIVVLFLFGIMLTRARIGRELQVTNRIWPVAALVSVLTFGLMAYALIDAFDDGKLPEDSRVLDVAGSNAASVSDSIFGQYLVAFEVVSVLLLAALVGAIVLARKE